MAQGMGEINFTKMRGGVVNSVPCSSQHLCEATALHGHSATSSSGVARQLANERCARLPVARARDDARRIIFQRGGVWRSHVGQDPQPEWRVAQDRGFF